MNHINTSLITKLNVRNIFNFKKYSKIDKSFLPATSVPVFVSETANLKWDGKLSNSAKIIDYRKKGSILTKYIFNGLIIK